MIQSQAKPDNKLIEWGISMGISAILLMLLYLPLRIIFKRVKKCM